MSLLHSLDIEKSGGLSGKGLGFSVELCQMSHKLRRQNALLFYPKGTLLTVCCGSSEAKGPQSHPCFLLC